MARPILVGILAAGLGAVAGTLVGVAGSRPYSDDIPVNAIWGFLVGEAVMLPIGVHVGNASRGRLAPDLAASVLGGAAALGIGLVGHDGSLYLVGVAGQLGATVWVERDGATRKELEAAQRPPAE